jgi:hypothetical protein
LIYMGRRGSDRMVVGFTITYAIGAYHHWCCGFKFLQGRGVQHYVIKFVSDLRQVRFSPGPPVSSINKTDCHDITEIILKPNQTIYWFIDLDQVLVLFDFTLWSTAFKSSTKFIFNYRFVFICEIKEFLWFHSAEKYMYQQV